MSDDETTCSENRMLKLELKHLREIIAIQKDNSEQALQLARHELASHLHDLNDWKQQTLEDRKNYVTRELHDAMMQEQQKKIDHLSTRVNIGVGILLALQFGTLIFIEWLKK